MTQNKYVKSKSMLTGILTGALFGTAVLLVGSLIITSLIHWETMRYEAAGYAVMILVMIATLVGCFVAGMVTKNQILLVSMSVGGLLLLFMLAVTAVFYEGRYSGVWVTLTLIMGSSLASALLCTRIQNRPKSYRKKR